MGDRLPNGPGSLRSPRVTAQGDGGKASGSPSEGEGRLDQEPGHSSSIPLFSIIPEPLEILLIDSLPWLRKSPDNGIQSRLRRRSLMTAVVEAYDTSVVIEPADYVAKEPDFAVAVVFLQHLRVVFLELRPRADGRDHAGFNLAHVNRVAVELPAWLPTL